MAWEVKSVGSHPVKPPPESKRHEFARRAAARVTEEVRDVTKDIEAMAHYENYVRTEAPQGWGAKPIAYKTKEELLAPGVDITRELEMIRELQHAANKIKELSDAVNRLEKQKRELLRENEELEQKLLCVVSPSFARLLKDWLILKIYPKRQLTTGAGPYR